MEYVAADLAENLYGNDELLGPNITEEVATKAIQWLTFFARKLGVNKDSIRKSFACDALLEAYAFREVCVKKSYSINNAWRPTTGRDHSTSGDYYSQKLAYYEARVKRLEETLTAADLTDGEADIQEEKPFKGYRVTEMYRG